MRPCDSVPQLVRPKLRVTECEMAARSRSICTQQTIFGGNKAALLHHPAERKRRFIRTVAQQQRVRSARKFSEKPATFRRRAFCSWILPAAPRGEQSEASDGSANISIFIPRSSLAAPGGLGHAYSINKRRLTPSTRIRKSPRRSLLVLSGACRRDHAEMEGR